MKPTTNLDTQRLALDPAAPDSAILAQAASVIQRGGLVAFPTETVYGLGANALDATAVSRIFTAKDRPTHDPIIVHVASAADLPRLTAHLPEMAQQLAAAFWPGPLTLVLPKSKTVSDIVTANGPTVAVRCPQHPLALALIRAADTPIAAPSANRFSHTSPTTAQHVWDDLAGRIDLILDGGPTPIGVESTVLDVTGPVPVLLRPGGVPLEALQAIVGEVALRPRQQATGDVLPSPGMLDKHYAPRAELWLFTGSDWAAQMLAAAEQELGNGRSLTLLLAAEDQPTFAHLPIPQHTIAPAADLDAIARHLFATLRRADQPGTDLILARDFPPHGIGRAIRDRLRRAAAKIIGEIRD